MSTNAVENPSPGDTGGISHHNRALLEHLHRSMPGAFNVLAAAYALDMSPDETRRLLGYLARRGWLTRVRRGLYVAVPLDARRSGQWIEDAWVVAERSFSPCYLGGWTACQHWSLTEQLFRSILVVTSRKARHRDVVIQGTPYHLTVRHPDKMFGTTQVWRGQVRVQVSDPSRTLIDLLDDPRLGGGIRTVADVVHEYFDSDHRADELLVDYGDRLGNRTVFKRLGWIVEHNGIDAREILDACRERIRIGLARLDPSVDTPGHIVRRWGLRVNVDLGKTGGEW